MLRAARESAGLTQEDVAAILDASQSFVSKASEGNGGLTSWKFDLGVGSRDSVSDIP